ncbi:MAG: phospholipase D-like domain-containing protein [Propionibacteriaceae bacterium]|nr:phospholipase D-like domain-containing protein [Propionibacteriaceae bacterium]
MLMGGVRKAVRWGLLGMATAQAGVIATLMVADRRRRRSRQHVAFPTVAPQTMPAGETEITVYTKGRDLFDAMIAAIDAAEHTVLLETYIWKADRTGKQFKRAVTAAAARGVDVFLVYDSFANLVVPQSFFRFDPRIQVLRHRPWTGLRGFPVRAPGLNHRKVLVVDSRVGFLGGYNLGSEYATRWRDTHMRMVGPAVADLENAFVDYWNQTRSPKHKTLPQPDARPWESPITLARNVPSVGVYPIRYMYLEAIDRARERIWLTHAYLIPDDDLVFALVEAVDRGVDVRIIVPAESNHVVADWLSRVSYQVLLSRGVRVFLYQNAMVHAKTATIDGVWSTIGTANIDRLSLVGNYELNAEVLDADIAAMMEEIFTMDLGNCRELTLEEWEARPLSAKVSEAIIAPLRPLL